MADEKKERERWRVEKGGEEKGKRAAGAREKGGERWIGRERDGWKLRDLLAGIKRVRVFETGPSALVHDEDISVLMRKSFRAYSRFI